MEIKAGGVYRTRGGNEASVTDHLDGDKEFPFLATVGMWTYPVTALGSYHSPSYSKAPCPMDLVAPWEEAVPVTKSDNRWIIGVAAAAPQVQPTTPEKAPDVSLKDTNPKDAIGSDKLPLHLWPTTATAAGSIALLNGALKYGRANWRHAGVRATIYADAIRRHLDAWLEGEEVDPDDGVPHLWAILAGTAILIDAKAATKLTDDRNTAGGYRDLVSESTAHVKRLKELHKGRSPKHYTIADLPQFP